MSTAAEALREQRLLRRSLAATVAFALASIGVGLWTGSKSIAFDGLYGAVDAGMTTIAIFTAGLIARGHDRRFQFGYWHLEPMLALVNALLLGMACLYALVDGLNGLLSGGRTVALGVGASYAFVATIFDVVIALAIRRAARGLNSQLVEVDARSWLSGAVLSAGLCISFVTGGILERTSLSIYAPYVDPLVLLGIALVLLPFPVATLIRSGREILQIAPRPLDARMRALAAEVAHRHDFAGSSSYVAQVGRQTFVEIGLIATPGATTSYAQLDRIRAEIADAIGGQPRGLWLTVEFTEDSRWL